MGVMCPTLMAVMEMITASVFILTVLHLILSRCPEVDLYVRVLGYEGGAHVFSYGSDVSSKTSF